MAYIIISLVFFLTFFIEIINAQEAENPESDKPLTPPSIFYGSVKGPIVINLHQTAVITDEKIQIKFSKLLEDSRCPSDVTCVWQGRASVQLYVTSENHSKQIVLSTENATIPINDNYSLVLLDVNPYPTSNTTTQQEDYQVRLELERIGPSQSPLQQFKSGIPINEIQCTEEFVLIFKTSNENPACVTNNTGKRLIERGWATCLFDKISYTRGHPCGPSSGHPTSFDSYREVVIVVIPERSADSESKLNYDPSIVTVVIGKNNTVTWINQDHTASTIVSNSDYDGHGFSSPLLLPDDSWEHTFTKSGIYEYHGEPHPWKNGKVIVLEGKENEN